MKWFIIVIVVVVLASVALWLWEAFTDDFREDISDVGEYAALKETNRKDISKVDEYAALKDTKKWFKRNDIGFGHGWNNDLYCTPPYRGSKTEFERKNVSFYPRELIIQEGAYSFYAYPESSLAEYFSFIPGDTVLTISEDGAAKAVITYIGDYSTECFEGVRCRLELVDSTEIKLSGKFLVLMGDLVNYDGPIVQYAEYQPNDSEFVAIKDSLRGELDKAYSNDLQLSLKRQHPQADSVELQELLKARWEMIVNFYKISERINTHVYGVKQSTLPDTLYLFNNCGYLSTETAWVSYYLLIRINDSWQVETIGEPEKGGLSSARMICTLDLNGDGEVEFLGTGAGSIGLWTYFKSRSIHLKSGGYWGC